MGSELTEGQQGANHRASSILSWLLLALTVILGGVAVFFLLANQAGPGREPIEGLYADFLNLFVSIATGAVGALIVSRRRRNPIGWLLIVVTLTIVPGEAFAGYAVYGLITKPGSLPATTLFAWLQQWTWTPQFASWIFLLLLFPTGRLLSPRWRIVAWAGIASVAALALTTALVGELSVGNGQTPLTVPNPIGVIGGKVDQAQNLITLAFFSVIAALFAALISLIIRFRHAQGDERQQLKWFTYAAIPPVVLTVFSFLNLGTWYPILQNTAVLLVPVAIGIAILKYRLYDIDLLINRTLVYVPLTAILAGIFAASITLSQKLFIVITGATSDAATVLTTLMVVAAFDPLKLNLQNLVDRRFKEAPGPAKQLKAYNEQVRSFVQMLDAEQSMRWFLGETACAFDATGGAVYLPRDGELQVAYTIGEWKGDARISAPLESNGGRYGLVALAGRRNGAEYTPQDRATLQTSSDLVARALALTERMGGVRK